MKNYFNQLPLSQKIDQLGKCRFMDSSEFSNGVSVLLGKKIVIIGCGAPQPIITIFFPNKTETPFENSEESMNLHFPN